MMWKTRKWWSVCSPPGSTLRTRLDLLLEQRQKQPFKIYCVLIVYFIPLLASVTQSQYEPQILSCVLNLCSHHLMCFFFLVPLFHFISISPLLLSLCPPPPPPPGLGLPPSLHSLQQLHLQQPSQSGLATQDQVPVPGEHRPHGLGHMSLRRPLAPPTDRLTNRPTAQDSKPSSSTAASASFLNTSSLLTAQRTAPPDEHLSRFTASICLIVLPRRARNTERECRLFEGNSEGEANKTCV